MTKTLAALSVLLAATSMPTASYADLAFNAGVVSDYRYRGVSQTRLKPALQGGADWSGGGFYAGAWGSTIKWIKDVGGDSDFELDVYGGYKGEVMPGLGFDVGLLAYVYPSNKLDPKADTQEIYGALTYGPATLKYSHSLSNLFGAPDSKGSGYLDLSASFEVYDGWSLAPHVGHQKIKGPASSLSYTDYSLTLSKDFKGLVPSIAIVGTDLKKEEATVKDKFIAKTGLVLGVKYNF